MSKTISKAVAKVIESDIVYGGKQIVLPDDPKKMGYKAAAEALLEKEKEENTKVNAHETIKGNPYDGLAAFHAVLKREFGWAITKPMQSFFGPIPPQLIDVRTGPNPEDVIQVPVGIITVPALDGFAFNVHFAEDGLHLQAECKKYQAPHLKDIATKVREYLKTHSIYKGKAFRMPREWSEQPEFLTFGHMKEAELILSRNVQASVKVNVLTPIEKTDRVVADGIPVKRTVVLSGIYGTGKSMLCAVVGKLAIQHGWTVIYLDKTNRLADAIENAKRWEPCVLVAEDVDRVAESRTEEANTIFNTLSGVLSGNNKVMVLLTTNHPEKIDRAMLRPGRIDALIEVTPPDAEAVRRLIELYGRGLIKADESLEQVGEMLAGQIPATIREVVERSKLARIANDQEMIDELSLIDAVHSLGAQITLLNTKKVEGIPTLDAALKQVLTESPVVDGAIKSAINGSVEAFARYLESEGMQDRGKRLRDFNAKREAELH